MTNFIVRTTQGRNISYNAESKQEAARRASYKHNVVCVFTEQEFEREREWMLLEWRAQHEKQIEKEAKRHASA